MSNYSKYLITANVNVNEAASHLVLGARHILAISLGYGANFLGAVGCLVLE